MYDDWRFIDNRADEPDYDDEKEREQCESTASDLIDECFEDIRIEAEVNTSPEALLAVSETIADADKKTIFLWLSNTVAKTEDKYINFDFENAKSAIYNSSKYEDIIEKGIEHIRDIDYREPYIDSDIKDLVAETIGFVDEDAFYDYLCFYTNDWVSKEFVDLSDPEVVKCFTSSNPTITEKLDYVLATHCDGDIDAFFDEFQWEH